MTAYRKQRKIGFFFKVQLFLSGHLVGLPLILHLRSYPFFFLLKGRTYFSNLSFLGELHPFPTKFILCLGPLSQHKS